MLDARFLHLYFYQSLHMLQCGLSAIVDLLVNFEKLRKLSRQLQGPVTNGETSSGSLF